MNVRSYLKRLLRWSEKYTETDMVYLAKGSFWLNANLVSVTILSFLLSIAFANFLPKEIFGTYQFALSIATVLSALTLTGMNNAVIQAVARGHEGSLRRSVPVQLAYGIVPFLVSLIIAFYYYSRGNLTLAASALILGLLVPVYSTFNTYTALFAGRKDFKNAFLFGQVMNFPYYLGMITLLIWVRNPVLLILANFGINTIIAIILYRVIVTKYHPNTSEDPETISYGKHLSLANIIVLISAQADNILVYHYIGAAELAIYSFATNIPERAMALLKSVSIAAFPKFSRRSRDELSETLLGKSLRLAALALAGTFIYIVLAPVVYKIFFPQYLAAIPYSQVYALMIVLASAASLPLTALTATKSHRQIYIYNIIGSVFNLIILLIMIKAYGIWGLIIGRGISNLFNFIILQSLIKWLRI